MRLPHHPSTWTLLSTVVLSLSRSAAAFAPFHHTRRVLFVPSPVNTLPTISAAAATTTTIATSFPIPPVALRAAITRASAAATSIGEITTESSDRMDKSIDSVKLSLTSIRTGRASPSILDRVKVDYYGALTPLNQLAGISVPSAQQLTIDPYDKKAMAEIERAIMEADLGLTPSNDGNVIRINIPALTEDRRKDLLKQCKSIGEEGKVAIRNVRRDGVDTIKKMEKAGSVGEDEMKDGLDVMQKMTDKSIKDIDDIVARKEKEVMTV